MTCKCGARSYGQHLAATARGYPAHVYRGSIWIVGHQD